MIYTLIDAKNLVHILFLTLLILIVLYLLVMFLKEYKCKYKIIMDNLLQLPIPLCIINLSNNRILDGNSEIKKLFNLKTIKDTDISNLDVFSKFESYLDIKNICKFSTDKNHTRIVTIEHMGQKKFYRVDFTHITLLYKKYMVMTLIDNTNIMNYIKKIGVLANVVDMSAEAIIVTRYESNKAEHPKILYANNALENVTGYNSEEATNKSLAVLFENNINDEDYKQLKTNLRQLKPTSLEYQYTKKNGEICWINTEIVPISKRHIFSSLLNLDEERCLDNLYENDISDIEIYITLYQKDITIIKEMGNIPKIYTEKISEIVKNKADHVNLINGILSLYNNEFDKIPISTNEFLDLLVPLMGKAFNCDRCVVMGIYEQDGKKYLNILSAWYHDTIDEDNLDETYQLMNNCSFDSIGAYDLYSHMITNKIFHLSINNIKSLDSLKILEANSVKSGIRCPVFKDGELIGMVLADDFTTAERNWENCDTLIRSIADNLTNII